MSEPSRVGGIDPGPKPGLVILHVAGGRLVRVERGQHLTWQRVVAESTHVQVERYMRGRASVRSLNAGAQLLTQEMARAACEAAAKSGRVLQALPAGVVKPWATDDRLRDYRIGYHAGTGQDAQASVYELTRGGGGHDRDAARHALYMAVRLGLLPKR